MKAEVRNELRKCRYKNLLQPVVRLTSSMKHVRVVISYNENWYRYYIRFKCFTANIVENCSAASGFSCCQLLALFAACFKVVIVPAFAVKLWNKFVRHVYAYMYRDWLIIQASAGSSTALRWPVRAAITSFKIWI